MNFNFGEVLSRSWQIIWKHKVLWIFGIMAGCARGSGGNFNSNSSFQGSGGNVPPQIEQWAQAIQQNMTTFIAVALALICIIWIVVVFIATIGRIGLIRGTSQVDGGAEGLVFGQLFSESMPYFWRMFFLSLIAASPVLVAVLGMTVAAVFFVISAVSQAGDSAMVASFGTMMLFIGCLCLLIPVMIVISLIARQAENAIVLEDLGLLPSISRGWEVFRSNLGPIIIMGIILWVLSAVTGFVIAIPIFVIVIPSAFTYMAAQGENYNSLIFMLVCLCLYTPVLWVLQGIVLSYVEAAWTLTYLRVTKPGSNAPVILEANA